MLIALSKEAQSSGYLISLKALAVMNLQAIWLCNSLQYDDQQGWKKAVKCRIEKERLKVIK